MVSTAEGCSLAMRLSGQRHAARGGPFRPRSCAEGRRRHPGLPYVTGIDTAAFPPQRGSVGEFRSGSFDGGGLLLTAIASRSASLLCTIGRGRAVSDWPRPSKLGPVANSCSVCAFRRQLTPQTTHPLPLDPSPPARRQQGAKPLRGVVRRQRPPDAKASLLLPSDHVIDSGGIRRC